MISTLTRYLAEEGSSSGSLARSLDSVWTASSFEERQGLDQNACVLSIVSNFRPGTPGTRCQL